MRIVGICSNCYSQYNNTCAMKKTPSTSINFKGVDEELRYLAAVNYFNANLLYMQQRKEMDALKQQALAQSHPNYDLLKYTQNALDAQEALVKQRKEEYQQYNSDLNEEIYCQDVTRGKKISEQLQHDCQQDTPDPKSINEVMGLPVGEWPFYCP